MPMTTESPEIRLRAAAPSDADDVIALSIETFRAEHAPSQRAFHERQAEWREGKSPTVVARNGDGAFLGYAFSRPNQAGVFERTDGQVAVLTQVAVVPDARGRGVGAALVSRSLTTLRMLGYSIASAQMQADVAPWYARQGWTIYPPGHVKAWIEPHIEQDDDWHPDLPAGSFSPILTINRLPNFPVLAEIQLTNDKPLLEAFYPGALDEDSNARRGLDAIAMHVTSKPSDSRHIPPALAAMMIATSGIPADLRAILEPLAIDIS